MKLKHSPEPWSAGKNNELLDAEGKVLALFYQPLASISRVAVCVNACAGLEDPAAAIQAAREAMQWVNEGVSVSFDYTKWAKKTEEALALLTPKETA